MLGWLVAAAVAVFLACLYLNFQRALAKKDAELLDRSHTNADLVARAENYRQQLKAVSDSSGAGVVNLDRRGRVLHANPAAAKMLETDAAAFPGRSLLEITLSRELHEVAVNPESISCDISLPGTLPRTLHVNAYRFERGQSGEPETMLVLVDVTDLRRLETIRRDFVANVSHELRTPLASIRAMAEMLADGAAQDPEVAPRFFDTILKETDRLTRISHDLLVLSDAESKKPDTEVFDLHEPLGEIVARYLPHAREAGIELRLFSDPGLRVNASRDQIEQVIVNLVDNAIKYTGGEGSVEVVSGKEGVRVFLEVRDTGIGIMAEHLPRLFERFYRVDKARSRESGGTGLGLSIVKNIIESHGGEVTVSSRLNHGSTFRVTLPPAE